MDPFSDRFDECRYEDDPKVGIFGYPKNDSLEVWVPERLWRRLNLLATAYELHYLGALAGETEARFLNSVQCSGLLDEIEFVQAIVDDSLLGAHLVELAELVAVAARSELRSALRVQGQ